MLSDFVRKKRKEGSLKTLNIENIQNAIEDAGAGEENSSVCQKSGNAVNKEQIFAAPHKKTKAAPAADIGDRKKACVGCLDDYDIVSESSFIVDSREILAPAECGIDAPHCPFASEQRQAEPHRPFASEQRQAEPHRPFADSIETRKLRVMNHATKNIGVKYSTVNAALYLPKSFKMVSMLYKIISTICSFNKKRGLALILVKYKDSIERLFRHRVEMSMLEQLNFIGNGAVRFVPVEVLEEGIRVATFKIDIVQDIDVDFALFNYLCEAYRAWLDMNDSVGPVGKMHPGFLDNVSVPTKSLQVSQVVRSTDEPLIRKIAKEKTGSILDRIREKERLRREEFVREQTVDRDYEGRLGSLFEICNKSALKMSDVLFKLGGFDCKTQVLRVLGDRYAVQKINGEEYIVKRQ